MSTREELEAIFHKHGCDDFKWMDAQQMMVAQWVRMKCTFGCENYGHKANCPPNTPSVEECRAFVNEYRTAAVIHFAAALPEREARESWLREINARATAVERDVFLAGYQKAFLMLAARCRLCADCRGSRSECRQPAAGRPTAEALGVDVYSTARRVGYPIHVLTDLTDEMNRYAFLLVE